MSTAVRNTLKNRWAPRRATIARAFNGAAASAVRNTMKNRWGARKATITRAFNAQRGPRPSVTRGKGARNLFSANRRKAGRIVSDLFGQGFENRDRMIGMAKSQYGYTNANIHFIEERLNAVGVYD
jgi:hypothetical protein